jgi:integrase
MPTGPTYLRALAEFRKLHELDGVEDRATVASVVKRWLDDYGERIKLGEVKQRSLDIHAYSIGFFVEEFGTWPTSRLTEEAVRKWLVKMQQPRRHKVHGYACQWGTPQIRNAVYTIKACLKWAVGQNVIGRNPLAALKPPAPRYRGEEAFIKAEQWPTILEKASGTLREYIIVLRDTGARPSEIANAEAKHFNEEASTLYIKWDVPPGQWTHKTARLGKDRIIRLAGEALAIIKRRAAQYKHGPLFGSKPRHKDKVPAGQLKRWKTTDITARFAYLRDKTGIPHLTAYSTRHTFATNWLMSGRSIEKLAVIMGNSPNEIRRCYKHLAVYAPELHAELKEFLGVVDPATGAEDTIKFPSGWREGRKQV